MGLDIRWPIGIMFSLIGVLHIIEEIATGLGAKSPGINIDCSRGVLLPAFGVLMLPGAARNENGR